jgi:hypothetical protein
MRENIIPFFPVESRNRKIPNYSSVTSLKMEEKRIVN